MIVATAAIEPDGMLCMATHDKGGLRATVLGSVSTYGACGSTQPLIVVGLHFRTTLLPAERGRLLVCSEDSTLSNVIATATTCWADRLRLEPWLTEVVLRDTIARSLAAGGGHRGSRPWLRRRRRSVRPEAPVCRITTLRLVSAATPARFVRHHVRISRS